MNPFQFHALLCPLCLIGSAFLPRHGKRMSFLASLGFVHFLYMVYHA